MRGAIPPLPDTPSWRGDQLKYHKDNFIFTFTKITLCYIVHFYGLSAEVEIKNREVCRGCVL
jgi:hypothetical protein